MITLKELENRVYRGKVCKGFDYKAVNPERNNQVLFEARFRRSDDNENEWEMLIVLERTRDADSQVYKFGYIMPRSGLPLELIAATGLKYFQLHLKEELQRKSDYDFALGDILRGM